ncbi:tetratricopeptide repeat protein [Acrasis kona]|uniref:Tetratricopeptide repeat protein 29 n=1 Tax=Acrasis kona TaxID=1008807 RepID=A0AAW2YWI4_9EUKA
MNGVGARSDSRVGTPLSMTTPARNPIIRAKSPLPTKVKIIKTPVQRKYLKKNPEELQMSLHNRSRSSLLKKMETVPKITHQESSSSRMMKGLLSIEAPISPSKSPTKRANTPGAVSPPDGRENESKFFDDTNYISLQSMRERINDITKSPESVQLQQIWTSPAKKSLMEGVGRNNSPEKTNRNSTAPAGLNRNSLKINLSSVANSLGNSPSSPSKYKSRDETDDYVKEMTHIENINKSMPSSRKSSRNTGRSTVTTRPKTANNFSQPSSQIASVVASAIQSHNEQRKSIFKEVQEEGQDINYAESEYQKYLMLKEMKERKSTMSPRSAQKFQEQFELSQIKDSDVVINDIESDEFGNIIISHNTKDKKPEAQCQEPLKLQYDPSQIQMSPVTSNWTVSANPTIGTIFHNTSQNQSNAMTISSLKDFMHMARACNRAGKNRMEGLTHYKLGCKYEELNDSSRAIKHYKRFFAIAQELGDGVGTSLALNCLGVCHHRLKGMENLKVALDYHSKHWEVADVQGKIVAHINIGLVYQKLGQIDQATENYRLAFQSALDIGDRHGESIALANLGLLGKDNDDLLTAQACMERHLLLSENMKDLRSSSDAYQQLGLLANKQGDSEQALRHLTKARGVAIMNIDNIKANQLRCNIGIVAATLKLDEYMKDVANRICGSIRDSTENSNNTSTNTSLDTTTTM